MLPDRVSNPGPLTYESGALPIALRGPAKDFCKTVQASIVIFGMQADNNELYCEIASQPSFA